MRKYRSRAALYFWRLVLALFVLTGVWFALVGLSVDRRVWNQDEFTIAP